MWRKNTSPSNTQKWSVVDWVPTRYFFLFLTVFVNCARPPTDTSRTWHRYLSCMLDVRWIFWITCGSVVRCIWIFFIFHGLNAMTSTVTTNVFFFSIWCFRLDLFEDYYKVISASFPDDNYFRILMWSVWELAGNSRLTQHQQHRAIVERATSGAGMHIRVLSSFQTIVVLILFLFHWFIFLSPHKKTKIYFFTC